ncbi:hypothetical protein DOTSEDRAFT_72535 [Dothistroma septosporum NZE10]|uniref:Uncharacterized protein n=1 Tax=Dothistroma septosporum (strain NZE10 / CBS 128990) TaxID=675120 RepID=M2XL00_DOTSN|nr:hypothetical protein DOTSEDRAFT_72535 [Dothistroma septosporum NZE10]
MNITEAGLWTRRSLNSDHHGRSIATAEGRALCGLSTQLPRHSMFKHLTELFARVLCSVASPALANFL